MTNPMLPPEVAEPLRRIFNRLTEDIGEAAALAHALPAPLAAQVRRRVHGETQVLLALLLAAPPCSLCPPEGGCSAATCRAG